MFYHVYMSLFEKGVRTIKDLLENDGGLFFFGAFNEIYNARAIFLEYEWLLTVIRFFVTIFFQTCGL